MFAHGLNEVFLKSYGSSNCKEQPQRLRTRIHNLETRHCPPCCGTRRLMNDEDHDGMILAEQQGSQEKSFQMAHDVQSNGGSDNDH